MRTLLTVFLLTSAALRAGELRIWAIDTEGGKATLYVAPSGESLLIDAGYAGNNGRDANRIAAAAAAAGIARIDHLVITHYHGDHAGGVPQLAAKLPIGRIYDRGDNEATQTEKSQAVHTPYAEVRRKLNYKPLGVGDTIAIEGLRVEVVAASGKVLAKALPGAGRANPLCATYEALPQDPGENARSLALVITFGKLRIADLGDLFWNQEWELACPANKIGAVDLYMTTHHGTATSGHPQIVHALHPKAAIMNNGEVKGGSAKALRTLHASPGLLDLWQLHYSKEGGRELNAPEQYIANLSAEADTGNAILVTASPDGSFTIRNLRNGYAKAYQAAQ